MSNPVSALNGASFNGFATIREVGPLGMISLRHKGGAALTKAIKAAVGTKVPAQRKIEVAGDKADQVLAKLSPVDFDTLEPGELRRSRAAQVAAAMWAQDGGFTLVCFRSVAVYVMGLLTHSAQPGSELA